MTEQAKQPAKQIKVSARVHKEIAHQSIEKDIDMQLVAEHAWEIYKRHAAEEVTFTLPADLLESKIVSATAPLRAAMERIETLARARVVEVDNAEEQELLRRIVQLLHVTGFQKRLRDLLREVEHERGKRLMTG